MYESEEYKIEFWRAATYGVRCLANALPLAITVAAFAFLVQSILSQPFTLTCKSEPMKMAAPAVVAKPVLKDLVNAEDEEKMTTPQAEPPATYKYKEQY